MVFSLFWWSATKPTMSLRNACVNLVSCRLDVHGHLFQFSVFVNSFGFFTWTIMLKKAVLFLPSQSVYLLFQFSYLITLAKPSSTLLKSSDEKEPICLVLDLMWKTSSFLPLGMMLAIEFLQIFFIKLRNFLSIPSLLRFFKKLQMDFGFYQGIFPHLLI